MRKLVIIAGLSLALAACGGESEEMDDTQADVSTDTAASQDGAPADDGAAAATDFAAAQEEFYAEYAAGEGTMSTASGLLYRVERDADGPRPGPLDIVEVHYEGRLVDGMVFDSSYERGETIEFPLNRVIAGWTEGLQLMPQGSKYQLVIPPELAYGSRGVGDIPPDSILVFDVELFNITPTQQ